MILWWSEKSGMSRLGVCVSGGGGGDGKGGGATLLLLDVLLILHISPTEVFLYN